MCNIPDIYPDFFPGYQQYLQAQMIMKHSSHPYHPAVGTLLITKRKGVTPDETAFLLVVGNTSHINKLQLKVKSRRRPFLPPTEAN